MPQAEESNYKTKDWDTPVLLVANVIFRVMRVILGCEDGKKQTVEEMIHEEFNKLKKGEGIDLQASKSADPRKCFKCHRISCED